jgi:hypothetical protein
LKAGATLLRVMQNAWQRHRHAKQQTNTTAAAAAAAASWLQLI